MVIKTLEDKVSKPYSQIKIGEVFKYSGRLFHKTECGAICLDNGLLLRSGELGNHVYVKLIHGHFQQTEKPSNP